MTEQPKTIFCVNERVPMTPGEMALDLTAFFQREIHAAWERQTYPLMGATQVAIVARTLELWAPK